MSEQTLVLIKPDGVKRGLSGEIIARFERAGLKVAAIKMIKPSRKLVEKHYSASDENLTAMGNKTVQSYEEAGVDVVKEMGTNDPKVLGKQIWEWNVEFLSSDPVVAAVFEGPNVVEVVRKLTGFTLPSKAAPGTIRGDFALESSITGNRLKRTIYNLVHASGNVKEAENEIKLWFNPGEISSYKRVHEDLYGY